MQISSYSAYVDEENTIWIPSSEINAVFTKNKDGLCNYLFSFEEERLSKCEIIKVGRFKDSLFFFERNRCVYWKYNMTRNTINPHKYSKDSFKPFSSAIFENDKVWVFPMDFNEPVHIIYLKDEKEEIIEWEKKYLDSSKIINCKSLFGTSMVKTYYFDGKIYVANRSEDNIYLVEINCCDKSIRGRKLENIKRINAIAVGEKGVYTLCLNNQGNTIISRINKKSLETEKTIDVSSTIKIHNQNPFEYMRMIYFGDNLIIFPIKKGFVTVVENMQSITRLKAFSEQIELSCYDFQIQDNKCYIFSTDEDGVSVIENNNNHLIVHDAMANAEQDKYCEALKNTMNRHSVIQESSSIRLSSFIESIV